MILPRCGQSTEGSSLTRDDAAEQFLVPERIRHVLLRGHAALAEQRIVDCAPWNTPSALGGVTMTS